MNMIQPDRQRNNAYIQLTKEGGRDLFWDSLKFILIFTVVYGHMVETYVADNGLNQVIYNFIYMFHMPLFVFISGRFSHINDKKKYLSRMLLIFESFMVFQIIKSSKPLFTGEQWAWYDVLIPKGTLWYLECLLLWRGLVYVIGQRFFHNHPFFVLAVSLLSGLSIGFIPITNGTYVRLFSLSFFFFLGFYSDDMKLKSFLNSIPLHLIIPSLALLFLFTGVFLNEDIRFLIYFACYELAPNIHPLVQAAARLGLYVFAIIVSGVTMRIILSKPVFANYGKYTLHIFLFHTFLILTLRELIGRGYIPHNSLLLFAYAIIICFGLAYLSDHFKVFRIILNPISHFLSTNKR